MNERIEQKNKQKTKQKRNVREDVLGRPIAWRESVSFWENIFIDLFYNRFFCRGLSEPHTHTHPINGARQSRSSIFGVSFLCFFLIYFLAARVRPS